MICAVETTEALLSLRPLALLARTFGGIICEGSFRALSLVTGELRATEWITPQRGGLVLIENPTGHPCQGSVFPLFEELTLPPGGIVACLHDTPIGNSSSYLAAYAGLVKSEAQVITAQIRPDPFAGIRLFVSSPQGTQCELVLFNAGPGQATQLTFTSSPQVVPVPPSQVVTLPEELSGRVWVGEGESPTWIGPDDVLASRTVTMGPHRLWELSAAGELTEVCFGSEVASLVQPGWYATQIIGSDEPMTAQLHFEREVSAALWHNGKPLLGKELSLTPGENRLVIHLLQAGSPGQVTLSPDGACYLLELSQWRYWPEGPLLV